jgi:hypothetical protein
MHWLRIGHLGIDRTLKDSVTRCSDRSPEHFSSRIVTEMGNLSVSYLLCSLSRGLEATLIKLEEPELVITLLTRLVASDQTN